MDATDLICEAWLFYAVLDEERYAEAKRQNEQVTKDVKRLLRLVRLCNRSYRRFERRCRLEPPRRVWGE